MTSTIQQPLTFARFLEQDLEEEGRYELVGGEIARILATRQHEDIADLLIRTFDREAERLNLNYRVSGEIVIRTLTARGREQGRHPDVSVVNKTIWEANREAYSTLREPLQLAVEVVATNWEDDYIDKLDECERLGIPNSGLWIIWAWAVEIIWGTRKNQRCLFSSWTNRGNINTRGLEAPIASSPIPFQN